MNVEKLKNRKIPTSKISNINSQSSCKRLKRNHILVNNKEERNGRKRKRKIKILQELFSQIKNNRHRILIYFIFINYDVLQCILLGSASLFSLCGPITLIGGGYGIRFTFLFQKNSRQRRKSGQQYRPTGTQPKPRTRTKFGPG